MSLFARHLRDTSFEFVGHVYDSSIHEVKRDMETGVPFIAVLFVLRACIRNRSIDKTDIFEVVDTIVQFIYIFLPSLDMPPWLISITVSRVLYEVTFNSAWIREKFYAFFPTNVIDAVVKAHQG